jgi:isopentenyl diphosphate isomerase/L-lactate dehydrogenase-like FMN-dependent dehydrogenase
VRSHATTLEAALAVSRRDRQLEAERVQAGVARAEELERELERARAATAAATAATAQQQQLKELLQDRIHALEAKLRNVNARVEQFAVFASG